MLDISLTGSNSWSVPLDVALTGSSSWSRQSLEISLAGESSWGNSLDLPLSGNSIWLRQGTADRIGTGGLYTRPAGTSTLGPLRPRPRITILCNGTKVPAARGSITLVRNDPTRWEIVLDDIGDTYGPGGFIGTAVRNRSAVWTWRIGIGDDDYEFRYLVAESYKLNTSGGATISGTDLSYKLNKPSFMADVDCRDFREVALETAANYGLPLTCEFDVKLDYYHRVGRPLEWFRDWGKYLADWSIENGRLTIRPVQYQRKPRWKFVETRDLEVVDFDLTPWAIQNRGVVSKKDSAQGRLLDIEEIAPSFYSAGFFGVKGVYNFPYPVRTAHAEIVYATRGNLINFSFIGPHGRPVSGVEAVNGHYGSTIVPATGVKFDYVPGSPEIFTDGSIWVPGFRVIFTGVSADRAQCAGGVGGKWTGEQAVSSGEFIDYEQPYVLQHHTAAVGQQIADNRAYEGALKAEAVKWQTEIAPWCRPAFKVSLTERRLTGYEDKEVFLETVIHRFDHSVNDSFEIADTGTTEFHGRSLLS